MKLTNHVISSFLRLHERRLVVDLLSHVSCDARRDVKGQSPSADIQKGKQRLLQG